MSSPIAPFPDVANCSSTGRERDTVVADMEGTLLRGRSMFPYFALVAYDMGGVLRLILVLLFYPIVCLLHYVVSESAGIQVLIFASFVGARVEDVESAARAVLPKFYSSDIHPESWRVFSSCGKRCVLTSNPRIMVEACLKDFLGAHVVLGTEVCSYGGRLTGLVKKPGVLVGKRKANALRKEFGDFMPQIGLGDTVTDFDFMRLCKEGYTVQQNPTMKAVDPDKLPKQIIFHDGRLVAKPTPLMAVLIILWIPIGFILACIRIAVGSLLPINVAYYMLWALGARVKIKGHPPPPDNKSGILFVSSHRTLLDPIIVSVALGRPITALTYSISRLTEMLSPIKTIRLSRDRITDARTIKELLREGDLVIFPEGTTCREPYLLRFSSLFAELTDEIVPVALVGHLSMFHATTVRGWKGMDPFYLFMNPYPHCEMTFLDKLPYEQTCRAGKSSHEVANYVQSMIGGALSYKCTSLTRKDKYQELAGIDGKVVEKKRLRGIKGLVAMLFWRQ